MKNNTIQKVVLLSTMGFMHGAAFDYVRDSQQNPTYLELKRSFTTESTEPRKAISVDWEVGSKALQQASRYLKVSFTPVKSPNPKDVPETRLRTLEIVSSEQLTVSIESNESDLENIPPTKLTNLSLAQLPQDTKDKILEFLGPGSSEEALKVEYFKGIISILAKFPGCKGVTLDQLPQDEIEKFNIYNIRYIQPIPHIASLEEANLSYFVLVQKFPDAKPLALQNPLYVNSPERRVTASEELVIGFSSLVILSKKFIDEQLTKINRILDDRKVENLAGLYMRVGNKLYQLPDNTSWLQENVRHEKVKMFFLGPDHDALDTPSIIQYTIQLQMNGPGVGYAFSINGDLEGTFVPVVYQLNSGEFVPADLSISDEEVKSVLYFSPNIK